MTTKTWRAISVSETGAAHIEDDIPCQDSNAYICLAELNTLIACVADGAGSARYSDQGSQVAVDAFIQQVRDTIDSGKTILDIARGAVDASRNAILDKSEGDLPLYATTLLGLVASENEWVAVQIGDGAILVDDQLAIESSHSGEYANETMFITNLDLEPDITSGNATATRVSMITDGLEGVALSIGEDGIREPYKGFFNPLYEWLANVDLADANDELRQFLRSERLRARTQDDITLLLAMR